MNYKLNTEYGHKLKAVVLQLVKVLCTLDILTVYYHIDCVVHIISYAIACLATICSVIGSVVGKYKLFTSKQSVSYTHLTLPTKLEV